MDGPIQLIFYVSSFLVRKKFLTKKIQIRFLKKNWFSRPGRENQFVTGRPALQNIVFINLQMNDEEKIQRFSALAGMCIWNIIYKNNI